MSKKTLSVLSGLCALAAVVMFAVGSGDPKLTELKDFFWVPIAPAILFGLLAKKK